MSHMLLETSNGSSVLEERMLSLVLNEAYRMAKPEGLNSPAFPRTLAPSAFHELVGNSLNHASGDTERWTGSDWVFRHADLHNIGHSEAHLSAFRMLVFFESLPVEYERASRHRVVRLFLELLASTLGADAKDLYITYYGGHDGLPPETSDQADVESVRQLWMELGVPADHLIAIKGVANLTNVLRVGEPAGPRCEVYLSIPNRNPLEIGTVVFERFRVRTTNPLRFERAENTVCGAALGVERCRATQEGHGDVFQLCDTKAATDAVVRQINPLLARCNVHHVRRIADAIRSACIIVENTDESRLLTKGQNECVESLRKMLQRSAANLGLDAGPAFVVDTAREITQQFNRFTDFEIPDKAASLLLSR